MFKKKPPDTKYCKDTEHVEIENPVIAYSFRLRKNNI